MLTKWAKNGLPSNNNDSYIPAPGTVTGTGSAYITAKTYAGNEVFITTGGAYYKGNSFYANQVTETTSGSGIIIGSDDTPATENDYCLGSQIYGSFLGSTSQFLAYDSASDSLAFAIALSITNNSDSAITIREIGRFATFDTSTTKGGSTSASRRRAIITDRTILDEPLTIEAGNSGTIQYMFTYFNNSVNNVEVKASKKK